MDHEGPSQRRQAFIAVTLAGDRPEAHDSFTPVLPERAFLYDTGQPAKTSLVGFRHVNKFDADLPTVHPAHGSQFDLCRVLIEAKERRISRYCPSFNSCRSSINSPGPKVDQTTMSQHSLTAFYHAQ